MINAGRTYTITYFAKKAQREHKLNLKIQKGELILNSFYYTLASRVYENWVVNSKIALEGIQSHDFHSRKAQQSVEMYGFAKFFQTTEKIDYSTYETYIMSLCFEQLCCNFFIVSCVTSDF